jgi:hypothetical protein
MLSVAGALDISAAENVLRTALKALQTTPAHDGIPRLWRAVLELLQCAVVANGGATHAAHAQLVGTYKQAIAGCSHPDNGHFEQLAEFVQVCNTSLRPAYNS